MSLPSLRLWPALLAILFARHYGWTWAPLELRGLVSKALGSVAALALLWLIMRGLKPGDDLARWAIILYAWHESSVVLCSTWFIFDPWPIATGQAMCSARVGFDLTALGLLLVAILASRGMTRLRAGR